MAASEDADSEPRKSRRRFIRALDDELAVKRRVRDIAIVDAQMGDIERNEERKLKKGGENETDEAATDAQAGIPPEHTLELTKLEPTIGDLVQHYVDFTRENRKVKDSELVPRAIMFDRAHPTVARWSIRQSGEFAAQAVNAGQEKMKKESETELKEVKGFYLRIIGKLIDALPLTPAGPPTQESKGEMANQQLSFPSITLVQTSGSTNPGGSISTIGTVFGLNGPKVVVTGHPEGSEGVWEGKRWTFTAGGGSGNPIPVEFGILTLRVPSSARPLQYPLRIKAMGPDGKAEAGYALTVKPNS